MKKTILTALVVMVLIPARAQLFTQESVGGAAVGGLIGGIIGHNSGRKTAEGVGIGAGVGLLLGALAHNSRRQEAAYYSTPAVAPVSPYYYQYQPARPNYAVGGAVLGGVAGGIIGHNSGRKTAEGIAIGAGTGLLFGGLAEHAARRRESYVAYAAAPAYVVSQPTAIQAPPTETPVTSAPQQSVAAASSSAPGPMAAANALFGR